MTATGFSWLARPGADLAYRSIGEGPPPLLLLHATLSSSRQLRALATRLAERFRVVAVDRRGSGETRLPGDAVPGAIDIETHVDDLAALIDAERLEGCLVVGHSFGGCLALELAARRPTLVSAAWVFEPPYAPLAPSSVREEMAALARRTQEAAERSGLAAAAETFMVGVSGQEALDRLGDQSRKRLRGAGWAALADAPLLGLEPAGLSLIRCPVVVATGGRSDPLYRTIGEAIVQRIRGAGPITLPDADHMAPIARPDIIAAAVEAFAIP